MNPSFPDFRRKHRAESVSPEPHRLVADVDAAFKQKILDLTKRQRITDVHHHREADDLGRAVEISEGFFHPPRIKNGLVCLKPFCSDNAEAIRGWTEPTHQKPISMISSFLRQKQKPDDPPPRASHQPAHEKRGHINECGPFVPMSSPQVLCHF